MPESTELEGVEGKSLSTPDPLLTSEGLAAAAVAIVGAFYVLFLDDSLTGEQATAITLGIGGLWILGQFLHAAWIRGKRATGGGLVSFGPLPVIEGQAAPHSTDTGDLKRP